MFSREMFVNRAVFDNVWWRTGKVASEFENAKSRLFLGEFYRYVTDLSVNRAMLLLGPRRVGKTWLLQHTIRKLLTDEVAKPNHILFFSVDIPVYHGMSLEDLVHLGAEIANVDEKSERLFVFFDEIQYLKDWQNHLKTLVDSYPNIRFVASGSAASALSKGSRESGAGRFSDHLLPPLSFYEYLVLKGGETAITQRELENGMVIPYVADVEGLNKTFLDYLNFGGYPELVFHESERDDSRRFIQRDIVDKILLRDLPSLYNIHDVRELQSFFSYLAFHSGMVQSFEALSKGSGIPKYSINQYLQYLEESYLVSRLDRVDITALGLKRATQFKLYLTNASLRAAMFQPIEPEQEPFFGHMVETTVSAQFGIGEDRSQLRYARWKTGQTDHEIDFIRINPGTQLPVGALEVKWSDAPFERPDRLAGGLTFLKRNNLKQLVVTSRTKIGVKHVGDIEITYIPTALYVASQIPPFLAQ